MSEDSVKKRIEEIVKKKEEELKNWYRLSEIKSKKRSTTKDNSDVYRIRDGGSVSKKGRV